NIIKYLKMPGKCSKRLKIAQKCPKTLKKRVKSIKSAQKSKLDAGFLKPAACSFEPSQKF
ncbi:MAG: hypothetical protein PHD86_03700, partial [Kiritimatiellae bacterium]|nr:hypothetical protein [Kiritimatiellia bacterium]